jgi:hypothetical protein
MREAHLALELDSAGLHPVMPSCPYATQFGLEIAFETSYAIEQIVDSRRHWHSIEIRDQCG